MWWNFDVCAKSSNTVERNNSDNNNSNTYLRSSIVKTLFIVYTHTNMAQGLKMGGRRLVNTILISNLTRLIHWPIHISKLKNHQNTSIKHITIILHSPKTTITKTTLLLHGLLNLNPYLQSEGEGNIFKKLNECYVHLLTSIFP